jgi:ribosomal protein S18 acetylase RimI-like enzyme
VTAPFLIEVLGSDHNRTAFSSGVEALDRYFREQVTQDVRRRATACYVALDIATAKVAGYYTLAAAGVALADLPEQLAKRLPRYPSVPVARLGRLAVDKAYRGQQLGASLLWDAAMRALRSEVAVFALVVDAKDDQAVSFYRHHGFASFGSLPKQLVLPLASLPAPPEPSFPDASGAAARFRSRA